MTKSLIHFSHANGFPAKSYNHFFSLMPNFDFGYINTMGHAGLSVEQNLGHLKKELLSTIEQSYDVPVIGMGHSSGAAATLLAAAEKPELFSRLILLDPVLLSRRKRFGMWMAKKLGLWYRFSPSKQAKNRRFKFASKKEAFDYYKTKSLFKNFDENCFSDYIEYGLTEKDNHVELVFSPQVESTIFNKVPHWIPDIKPDLPITIVYGTQSNLIHQMDVDWWKTKFKQVELIAFEGGHLFPQEQPITTANLLESVISTS